MGSRRFPALDLDWPSPPDEETVARLIADLDEWRPSGIEDRPAGIRVYFPTDRARRAAAAGLQGASRGLRVRSVDVPDEQWAERSQAALGPVTVGRIVVSPPWAADQAAREAPAHAVVTIVPSMGFGTGHHASTRLCLDLLQRADVAGRRIVDIGTGSGVLAIAAAVLGARTVLGLEVDPDAADTARENVARHPPASGVIVQEGDISEARPAGWGAFDLLLANLTGAALRRLAPTLVAGVGPGGALIVSGLEHGEGPDVAHAFERAGASVMETRQEDGWLAFGLRVDSGPAPARPE